MNDEFSFEKYVDMNKYEGNWFFYDKAVPVNEQDIKLIKPLTKQYSIFLWSKYISQKNRHLMLLEKNEWPNLLKIQEYNWAEDWNERNYNGLSEYLINKASFIDDDLIYFFWMKETGVETTWAIFLKYWINFLFEDEGPILISPEKDDAFSFGPSGTVLIGKRKTI